MSRRFICGKSQRFPLCDGTHAALGWKCEDQTALPAYAFIAGRHNENLAERLASELGGVAVHAVPEAVRAARVVLLVDAASLGEVRALADRVDAPLRRLVAIDLDASLVAALFPGAEIATVSGDPPLRLWRAVRDAVRGDAPAGRTGHRLAPAFVSHAVVDEPVVLPTIGYLREHVGADLFVCADSIEVGARWFDAIVAELQARPTVVWLLSKDAAKSTFCSFEIGFAMASGKRVVVVSLDGERPPSFAQHLHAIDLQRRRAVRPWLDAHELLTEAVLDALAGGAPDSQGRAAC